MKQPVPFYKMHGLGNDFVVIEQAHGLQKPSPDQVRQWADRHLGIGFDQLLLIGPSSKADFSCHIFNADGTLAEQCGNGLRCVARYIVERQLSDRKELTIETLGGVAEAKILDDGNVSVVFPPPEFGPQRIPFLADAFKKIYEIECKGENLSVSVLSMGNPHAIFRVPSVACCPVAEWGLELSTHSLFPKGANIGFMEILNSKRIALRTYERGAGETLSCGSNTCAAVVAGIMNDWLGPRVTVVLKHGELTVEWQGPGQPVFLTGPAVTVFKGMILSSLE